MKTTVSIGITVNLGNYESLRLDTSVEWAEGDESSREAALQDLRDELINHLTPLGSKAQSAIAALRSVANHDESEGG